MFKIIKNKNRIVINRKSPNWHANQGCQSQQSSISSLQLLWISVHWANRYPHITTTSHYSNQWVLTSSLVATLFNAKYLQWSYGTTPSGNNHLQSFFTVHYHILHRGNQPIGRSPLRWPPEKIINQNNPTVNSFRYFFLQL